VKIGTDPPRQAAVASHPRAPEAFDEVAAQLRRSLASFNVPERETEEVLGAFASHKGEVTEGSTVKA
jgi:hemoglobin